MLGDVNSELELMIEFSRHREQKSCGYVVIARLTEGATQEEISIVLVSGNVLAGQSFVLW